MKAKTPGKVISVLKDHIRTIHNSAAPGPLSMGQRHEIACLSRAAAIVRLWDAGITPADVRAAERKRKGRAK